MRPPTVARATSDPQRGQCPSRGPVLHERAGMHAAALAGAPGRRAKGTAEVGQLVGGQLVGGPAGRDPRLPQGLVGEQVADPRDDGLVQQARLDGGMTAAQPLAELAAA